PAVATGRRSEPFKEPLQRGSGEQHETAELDDSREAPPWCLPLAVDHGHEPSPLLARHAGGLDEETLRTVCAQEGTSPPRIELGDHVATEHEQNDAGRLQYFPRGCGSSSRFRLTQYEPFHGRTIGALRPATVRL